MIRPKWPSHATALRRCFSFSARRPAADGEKPGHDAPRSRPRSRSRSQPQSQSQSQSQPRPPSQLARPARDDSAWTIPAASRAAADEFSQWRTSSLAARVHVAQQEEQLRQQTAQALAAKPETQAHMLVVSGLSPALKPSDFYRLSGTGLAAWNSVINEVHQERDPWTLDPLGVYRISFTSADVATAFHDKLNRLLRLAQHKMHSPTGLWTKALPAELRCGATDADLEADLAAFTLAPGSQSELRMERSRLKGRYPWQRLMDTIIDEAERNGRSAAAVLLELRPASLTADELLAFIKEDEVARNQKWRLTRPYHLMRTLNLDPNMMGQHSTRAPVANSVHFREKLQGRFVVVLSDEDVAWRFIRSWNQRTLMTGTKGNTRRTSVNASLIEL